MDSAKTGLSEAGAVIRAALEQEIAPEEQIRAVRSRLLQHVTSGRSRPMFAERARRALGNVWVAGLAGGALAGICIWLYAARPISFEVGADAGQLGDLLVARGEKPVPLKFSEGSSILLQDGGRARVLATDSSGARVLLESGQVEVNIQHRVGVATSWSFEAGPYRVRVTGTAFVLGWNTDNQSLSLETKQGSVSVSGPCLDAPRAVTAGSALRLSCPGTEAAPEIEAPSAVTAPAQSSAVASNSGSAPEAVAGSVASAALSARPASASAPAQPLLAASADSGWREALRAGRSAAALQAAEHSDFAAVCQSATKQELFALADAARLSGRLGRATEALQTLRRRFPGTSEAATAAFALGRMAFDQRGAYGEASHWFNVYLEELPGGPLMGDAAGRSMEARARQGDREGAKKYAQRYLTRFPEGPYAAEARRILAE